MSPSPREQPTLTDGVVTLRAWRESDVVASVAGHDDVIAHWSGHDSPPDHDERRRLIREWSDRWRAGQPCAGFVVEWDRRPVGNVEIIPSGTATGSLSWTLYAGFRGRGLASRAVRVLADWALTEAGQGGLGLGRVEAFVEPENAASLRVATRAGLRREGVRRLAPGTGDRREASEYVILARLASDPPLTDPHGLRALLNSFLPRKRVIAQLLVRDPRDRVLLCQLTYKRDWDLPGGVVEVGESPQVAVGREVAEELGLSLPVGDLLLTDWLPPWGGWDDAVCLVFDGGRQDPDLVTRGVRQGREIRGTSFCGPTRVSRHATDFTARRVAAALARARGGASGGYTESGR